jgi:hypothetical protein
MWAALFLRRRMAFITSLAGASLVGAVLPVILVKIEYLEHPVQCLDKIFQTVGSQMLHVSNLKSYQNLSS